MPPRQSAATLAIPFPAQLFDGNVTTYGAYLYDFGHVGGPRARTDRATGKGDRYCATVKSDDTPCTHLVVGGERYLVFPALTYCCKCCTDAQGCGVVTPTWMVDSNGTFAGSPVVKTPNYAGTTNEFSIQGLQTNLYYETTVGAPVELAQLDDDWQYFDPTTFSVGPQPDSAFAIPSYCTEQCPLLSTCTFAADHNTGRVLL